MSKRLGVRPLILTLVLLLACSSGAMAMLCSIDAVPAATLLIPYFQVDVSDAACGDSIQGFTTIISVRNARAEPVLAHVTVWTDLAIPALNFDVYLAGYDTQVINVKDFFCSGNLPVTGAAISHHGEASQAPVPFPGCNNTTTVGDPPVYANPAIGPSFRTHLKEYFTGMQSSITGDCAGSDLGASSTAIGYITIDVVQQCSVLFPSETGYIDAVIGFTNTLLGDYQLVDPQNDFAQGFSAVHIEAAPLFPAAASPTFYGRYATSLGPGADQREPLPTTFALSYNANFMGTRAIVWREANEDAAPFSCGSSPSWWPLEHSNQSGLGALVPFDEESNPAYQSIPPLPGEPSPPLPMIPNATQMVDVGLNPLETPFPIGWYYLNLQSFDTVYAPPAGQAWVQVISDFGDGRRSSGMDAFPIDGSCPFAAGVTLSTPGALEEDPRAPFFADGFESGDTSAWSSTVP